MSDELMSKVLEKLTFIESNMATKADLDAIEVKVEEVTTRLTALETKVDRIEKKLDLTFEQTGRNEEKINQINNTLERHERILEILSKRSIEQESYLRR